MLPRDVTLSKNDFDQEDWRSVLTQASENINETYSDLFVQRAKAFDANGDKVKAAIYTALYDITCMHFKPEAKDEPFGPAFVLSTGRGTIMDDFNDNQLETFKAILPEITDHELKSRIGDVLWIRRRDHEASRMAVNSYLESAKLLEDPDNWVQCFDRVQRAVGLAAQLGGGDLLKSAITHIETVLARYDGNDGRYLSSKLMELLLEYGFGDAKKYGALAEKIAKTAEAAQDYQRANVYWTISGKWKKKAGDADSERVAKVQAAETHVREAEGRTTGPQKSFLVASMHPQSAIEAFRRIGGMENRLNELHAKLLEYQKQSVSELKQVSIPLNIGDTSTAAEEMVKGKSFDQAILTLATLGLPQSVNRLRERANDLISKHPLQHFVGRSEINSDGKTVARPPSAMGEEREAAVLAEMFKNAAMGQQIHAVGVVEPARQKICLEHPCRMSDLSGLVLNNPFVPPGREMTFLRGIHAGLNGDWLVSAHVLVPQVESSIRYLLAGRKVITSKFDDDGIQDEFGLSKLLCEVPATKEVFGEDLLFDLRGLLVERTGSYLRHRLSHGLLSDAASATPSVCYFWWSVLRILSIPYLQQGEEQEKPS